MPRAKGKGGNRKAPPSRLNSRNTRGSSSLSPVKSSHSKSELADSPLGIPDNDTPLDLGTGQDELPEGFDPALLLDGLGEGGTIDMSVLEDQGGGEEVAPDADFLASLEFGLGIGQNTEGEEGGEEQDGDGDGDGDVDMDESASGGVVEVDDEEDEDEDDEEGGDEEEDEDDAEEEGDEEDGDDDAEDEDEDDDEDEDEDEGDGDADADEDDDGTQRDEWVDCPEDMTFRYPAAVPDFTLIDGREQEFKMARFLHCQAEDCTCEGLEPPMSSSPELKVVSREEMESGELEDLDVPEGVEEGAVEKWRSDEGWWKRCGRCGHGWEGDGHVFTAEEASGEKIRKGRVVGRIEELLQVSPVRTSEVLTSLHKGSTTNSRAVTDHNQDKGMLTTFPTPQTKDVISLLKQLNHFVRPSGKKPAGALPNLEPGSPGAGGSVGTPATGGPDGHDSDDERPRKRSRKESFNEDGEADADADAEAEADEEDGIATSPRHGKKPGGKSAGKGTKPRTVVRGVRGLVPMEIEADGSQHPAGDLPESAKPKAVAQKGVDQKDEEADEDEDDVPLAKRPELDEKERKRRELAKEKAREKEDEVVRRLTKGANVDEGADVDMSEGPLVDVEVWEGVELVCFVSTVEPR